MEEFKMIINANKGMEEASVSILYQSAHVLKHPDTHIDRWMDGEMDEWIDRKMKGWIDRIDRQIDK